MFRLRDLGVCAVLVASGCSGADGDVVEPTWQRLALGFRPAAQPALGEWGVPAYGGEPLRLSAGAGPHEYQVEYTLRADQWVRRGPRTWSAPRPIPTVLSELTEDPTFVADGVAHPLVTRSLNLNLRLQDETVDEVVLGLLTKPGFTPMYGQVHLVLPEEGAAPARTIVREGIRLGFEENGAWRVPLDDLVADAIPVLAGAGEEVRVDLPPGHVLRFGTIALGGAGASDAPPARFRVRLDGELLWEHEQPVARRPDAVQHVVTLPADGVLDARLSFEVAGPACLGAFTTPLVGPASSSPAAGPRRPDIVVFVVDTFRADNLVDWGGDPDLAPNLNRLADESVVFRSAQAPATWTLPSHASFFSGLYPRQAGVWRRSHSLSGSAHTIAEHLSDAGYRTVAITERGLVARSYGLAQGFQWFRELSDGTGLDETVRRSLERAAIDDGRPLFLFVQSYRAHTPYVVSAETRARLPQLGLEGVTFASMIEEMKALQAEIVEQTVPGVPFTGRARELMLRYRNLYRGASADLDRGVGRFLSDLEDLGRGDAVFVAMSDHGEAFGEHGVVGHGVGVWQEESLVPLIVRVPGRAPSTELRPVSLVSLPRTLCGLAGVEPHAAWLGHDLLVPEEWPAGPLLTYQGGGGKQRHMGLVEGRRKLVLRRQGGGAKALRYAYDLAEDFGELEDCSGEVWAKALFAEWETLLAALDQRLLDEATVELDAAHEAQLRELGYLGEDE